MRFLSLLAPDDIKASRFLNLGTPVTIDVSSGAAAVSQTWNKLFSTVKVDVTTLTGGTAGDIVVLQLDTASSDVPTLKDNTGNLRLAGDIKMDSPGKFVVMLFDGLNWNELTRSNN